jgi:hypothetical protein
MEASQAYLVNSPTTDSVPQAKPAKRQSAPFGFFRWQKTAMNFLRLPATFCRGLAPLCRSLYSFVPPGHHLSGFGAEDSYFFPMLALVADILLTIFDLNFDSAEIRQTRYH